MATRSSFWWGNDDFKSRLVYELLDVSVDMMEMTVKYSFSNTSIGSQGGFYFDPIFGIKRDGELIAKKHVWVGQDEKVTNEITITLEEPGTFTPSLDVIGAGDYEFTEYPKDSFNSVEDFWGDSPDRVEELVWPTKVTAQEPPDISELELSYTELSSNEDFTINIGYLAENVIKSGDGERIEETIGISMDADKVHSKSIKLDPGDEEKINVTLTNTGSGDRTICIGKEDNL